MRSVSRVGYKLHHVDALAWLRAAPAQSVHAVVTDPPFGVEYDVEELRTRAAKQRGIWRLPPAYDGADRQPLPRFTCLSPRKLARLDRFFTDFASELIRVLVPGAHVFVATNPVLSHVTYAPFIAAGFEQRGEIVRTTSTLRGGDRPKNAHLEYPEISVLPRSRWEPWGLFRKPIEGTVTQNLKAWGTGGLRRPSKDEPFADLIVTGRTPARERAIAPHPSLKPQSFLRLIVRASLPLGRGIILDPFMGSGSTIAAARALGLQAIGIERDESYFTLARSAIPQLAALDLPKPVAHATRQQRKTA